MNAPTRLRAWMQHMPLRTRLSLVLTLYTGLTALVGFLGVIGSGYWFHAEKARQEATEQARLIAFALQAPVAFHDRRATESSLRILRAQSNSSGAWVYDRQGGLLGTYGQADDRLPPAAKGSLWSGFLRSSEAIYVGDDPVGHVVVVSDLSAHRALLLWQVLLIGGGSLGGVLLTLWLAQRLATRITGPITALAKAAGDIAEGNFYSQRLGGAGRDEVGQAVRSFNKMLDEVQARDAALEEANQRLEGHVRERTHELQVEKQRAEAASRAKTRFLANVSHELRTPLNAVIGAAQLLHQQDGGGDQAHLVDAIRTGGTNLLSLIDNVLDISKIESGGVALIADDFDLFDCIDAAVSTAAVAARAKGLELASIVAPQLAEWRHGDSVRLRQVLMNLLGNAVKFTSQGEVVLRVGPGATPSQLAISVRDTGVGIPPGRVAEIFEPFRQGDEATTRQFGGTGLGLAISRQLVQAMKGRIAVDSEPGRGSVFRAEIELPPARRRSPAPAPLGLHVVFFEPHEASATALAALLQRMGCHAARVQDAAELSHWLSAHHDDAAPPWLLVDIDSPRAWPMIETAAAAIDPEHLIGMSVRESHQAELAREALHIPRSVVKPVLRAALVSRFGVLQPATPTAPTARRRFDPGDHGPILVVEDDPMNQIIVRTMLENAGFAVDTASGGTEAIAMLSQREFSLTLMDWQMPDMDGLEVTRRLRRGDAGPAAAAMPIIALTANAFSEDRAACIAAGMNDFLTKPVLIEQLVAMVRRWAPSHAGFV